MASQHISTPTPRPALLPRLFGFLLAPVLLGTTSLSAQSSESRPLPLYNPELLETRLHLEQDEYLVGEPIYWSIEFINHTSMDHFQFNPSYQADVFLEVKRPGEAPFRYFGTTQPLAGMKHFHEILPGDNRFFHFRVYYDNDPAHAVGSKLLFPEPMEAVLVPAVRYTVNQQLQAYSPSAPFRVRIVEPTGRDAECMKLISREKLVRFIHDEVVPKEDFPLVENILNLYSDTAYAPYLALSLANGYYNAAIRNRQTVDEEMMQKAIAAYTVLLQVDDIPYIQEYSFFMIAVCHQYLGNIEAFGRWYQKYLDTYGLQGRFAFRNNKYYLMYEKWRPEAWGEHWYMYP